MVVYFKHTRAGEMSIIKILHALSLKHFVQHQLKRTHVFKIYLI